MRLVVLYKFRNVCRVVGRRPIIDCLLADPTSFDSLLDELKGYWNDCEDEWKPVTPRKGSLEESNEKPSLQRAKDIKGHCQRIP